MEPTGQTKVAEIWRYPVKSMMGERVAASAIASNGLAGDRAYGLVDIETGHIASAKNPRRWRPLFSCTARFLEEPDDDHLPPVEISLPDGSSTRSDAPNVDQVLSLLTGRDVRLQSQAPAQPMLEEYWPDIDGVPTDLQGTVTSERIALLAPPGTFFDGAPVHLVTTATLAALTQAYPAGAFDVRRFRPNLLLETAHEGFVEDAWVDRSLAIGHDVHLDAILSVPRCVKTTLEQDDLPADKGILRTVARENRIDVPGVGPSSCVGIYASVARSGVIRRGDTLEVFARHPVENA